jgi:hypothetical protein
MKPLLPIALAVVSFASRSAATDANGDAESQKPIKLEKVTVTASRLDLNPDPSVDYVVPKVQIIFEYLGHDVPGNAIMQAKDLQDLKDNWRPTYSSLDEFISGISREGWKVAAKRDLKDFYIVVFATPHGNIAGEYYAKTSEGRKLQRLGKIRLFVSDDSLKQIVPDSGVFTLEQRMKYSVYVNDSMHGLMPAIFSEFQRGLISAGGTTYSGWLIFHQGDLFVMPPGVKHFLFVFEGGANAGDRVELAFSHWSRS